MTYEWIPIAAAAIVSILGAVGLLIGVIRDGNKKIATRLDTQDAAIEVVRKDVNSNLTGMMKEVARHAMGKAVATGSAADMKVAVNAELNAENKAALAPAPEKKV